MARPVVVTSAPVAPEAERHHRMRQYAVTMTIRFACFVAIIFVEGWWQLVCLLGAVFLPYIAVMRANNRDARRGVSPEAADRRGLPAGPNAQ